MKKQQYEGESLNNKNNNKNKNKNKNTTDNKDNKNETTITTPTRTSSLHLGSVAAMSLPSRSPPAVASSTIHFVTASLKASSPDSCRIISATVMSALPAAPNSGQCVATLSS